MLNKCNTREWAHPDVKLRTVLCLFLFLTFVMLKHSLLQLFPLKISFFKSNQGAFGDVGVHRDRKITHLGLVFVISDD